MKALAPLYHLTHLDLGMTRFMRSRMPLSPTTEENSSSRLFVETEVAPTSVNDSFSLRSRAALPLKEFSESGRYIGDARILVVDNDAMIRDGVAAILLRNGYQVCAVRNAEMALEMVSASHFDLVILDMMLAGISGFDLTIHLYQHHPELPVILITTQNDTETKLASLDSGLLDYTLKPFHVDVIPQVVHHILTKEQVKHQRKMDILAHTVEALVASMDAKAPYITVHSQRVTTLAKRLAYRFQLTVVEQFNLELAARLHDVGKITIPDAILHKPGKLDADEWAVIKTHVIEGEKIMRQVPYLAPIALVIRHHHEHWDGSGYPDGLKGEEIPLLSRIISVADAYEAMTAMRAYHSPYSREEALQRLQKDSGKQFDPAIVAAFLQIPL